MRTRHFIIGMGIGSGKILGWLFGIPLAILGLVLFCLAGAAGAITSVLQVGWTTGRLKGCKLLKENV